MLTGRRPKRASDRTPALEEKEMKVLIVSADNFEDTELLAPYYRFLEEGFQVDVASMRKGKITGKHGYEVEVNKALEEINPEEYDLLILPGGKAPAAVRKEQSALKIAEHFFSAKKPVAAICHGPETLIAAGLIKGRKATCYHSVAAEMKEAGADYQDREVVVDGNLVTSRHPPDIPAFMREIMRMIGKKS
jgi:protease I